MGAWGTGSFENDDAVDWLWDLDGPSGAAAVRAALDAAALEEHLECDQASVAVAAAEVVAVSLGVPPSRVPDEVSSFVEEHGALLADLGEDALAAVRKVQDASELADVWAQKDAPAWETAMEDLSLRLERSV